MTSRRRDHPHGDPAEEVLLIIPIGGGPAERVPEGGQAVVGRRASCFLRINHPQISREHARLESTGRGWLLVDLESSNGTFVNQQRVEPDQPVVLRDGDTVSFGPCAFSIRIRSQSAAAESQSDHYVTRASIFIRMRHEQKDVRELGWEEFRQRYAPVIIGFTRNAGLPPQDAEDVLQEVMLRFFRVVPEFEYDPARGRFRGYLKRATLNVIRDRGRARPDVTVPEEWLREQNAEVESVWEEQWASQLLARAMEKARLSFDPITWEAFELYGQRGVPAEEVARRLNLNVASVHQARSRIVKCVREIADRMRAEEG